MIVNVFCNGIEQEEDGSEEVCFGMFCLILICILCGSFTIAVYADDNKEKSAEAKEAAMAGSEENHAEKTDAPNGTASGESEVADAGIFNYSGFGDEKALEATKKKLFDSLCFIASVWLISFQMVFVRI